jgi:hypothetical protein
MFLLATCINTLLWYVAFTILWTVQASQLEWSRLESSPLFKLLNFYIIPFLSFFVSCFLLIYFVSDYFCVSHNVYHYYQLPSLYSILM